MATTTISWGDGSGDNIYLTYPSASGDQTVEVSSDANAGADDRSKTITFTTTVGNNQVTRALTLVQEAVIVEPVPDHICITFHSSSSNAISLTRHGSCAPVLYYSTDGTTWTQWDYSAISISRGNPLFVYGSNTSGFSSSASNYANFTITGNGEVTTDGSVSALINGTNTLATVPRTYCFYGLFSGCDKLKTPPSFPSTTLKDYCYQLAFNGCSSLITAPELPARTATARCYREMFLNCTSLTTAPTLPATTLGGYSYYGMFQGCSALVNAPVLNATNVVNNAYQNMFRGCSSLVTAPNLPATTVGGSAYSNMFRDCISLVNVQETLPATKLGATNTYEYMFCGCKSLVTAPNLPATSFSYTNHYQYMFYGCTSLVNAPVISSTTSIGQQMRYMFYGCTSLEVAPELKATTLASACYQSMFQGCSKLRYIKAMFTTTPSNTYTKDWVNGVAASGVFVKNSAATWTNRGNNAVPNNWTIETASS